MNLLSSVVCCNPALTAAQELVFVLGLSSVHGADGVENPPVFIPGSCTTLAPGCYKLHLFTLVT